MPSYIEVEMRLDSLDLIQIETLLQKRIDELNKIKKESANVWLHREMANEQLANYRETIKKVKAARQEIKRIKAESDASFQKTLKARNVKVNAKTIKTAS